MEYSSRRKKLIQGTISAERRIYEGMEPEIAMMVDFRGEASRRTGEVA